MTRRLPLASLVALLACAPSAEDVEGTRGGKVDVFFNSPGTRPTNLWEPDAVKLMVQTVQHARTSIDLAVMGFNRAELVDALVAAHDRGVQVRMVGDGGHLDNLGYVRFRERHIPMVPGNTAHIMHDKFMVVDGRFVWASTANWTDSDMRKNSNSFVMIDQPDIAAVFTAEFQQMFAGRFGQTKQALAHDDAWDVGDTRVEVWFAPKDDALGRMLELVDDATDSVRFAIFAFTKDTLGSALLRKQAEFDAANAADGLDPDAPLAERRSVAGVIDQSQLHSNGQFHEVYRLLGGGVDVRMDGNDNADLPGDYQAGGGRLHSKTMILDGATDHPVILSGSFNWSSSATQSNDEYLLVFHGKRLADAYEAYWRGLWDTGRQLGVHHVGDALGDHVLAPGDLVIDEVHWFGLTDQDADGNDEFLELRNLTDHAVRLDLWQIQGAHDIVVGIPPGMVIPARGRFTVLDHQVEPYQDGVPQDEVSAFRGGDMVVNAWNDNRQARLYLSDSGLALRLVDPNGVVVDTVGDGGPPFAGGPDGDVVRSMERADPPGDGTDRRQWHACSLDEGGANVNEAFRAKVIATPGEANSPR